MWGCCCFVVAVVVGSRLTHLVVGVGVAIVVVVVVVVDDCC